MTVSSVGQVPRAAFNRASGPAGLIILTLLAGGSLVRADEPALRLRATPIGVAATEKPISIELFRWSTESERGPLLAALAPPAPAPAPPANAEPPAAGRATGRAAGRGGRGGRGGGGGAAAASPLERLTGAVKAAPTIGFIWGGVTGYSVKYAWHAPAADGTDRVVLVTDRRLDVSTPESPSAGEFTVIEMLIDPKGVGEAKTSLTTAVVVDAAARTLALDGYRAAPVLLKVTR